MGSNHHQQAAEENRQAIMLFAIVALFLICHSLRNLLSFHEAFTFAEKKKDYFHGCAGLKLWILVIGLFSHLLLACNSAFNFFVYCLSSEQFRTELKKVFGTQASRQNSPVVPKHNLVVDSTTRKNSTHILTTTLVDSTSTRKHGPQILTTTLWIPN